MYLLCLLPPAVPVGVGSEGVLTLRAAEMDKLLNRGMAYVEELGLSWPEDRLVTEENVRGCRDAAVQVDWRCCQQQLVGWACRTIKFWPHPTSVQDNPGRLLSHKQCLIVCHSILCTNKVSQVSVLVPPVCWLLSCC